VLGYFSLHFHNRFGRARKVSEGTACPGRVCSCHFFLEGKGGDAMKLPCMTHRAESTTSRNQGKSQREARQQAVRGCRERREHELASEHMLSLI